MVYVLLSVRSEQAIGYIYSATSFGWKESQLEATLASHLIDSNMGSVEENELATGFSLTAGLAVGG